MIRIQTEDFDFAGETRKLHKRAPHVGAVVSFVGLVRPTHEGARVVQMTLECYPAMAEQTLAAIVNEAKRRWDISDAVIIHRFGILKPADQIVMVIAAGAHRGDAFAACEFMIDYLKTRGPFWKKESTANGEHWVEARASDNEAATRWRLK